MKIGPNRRRGMIRQRANGTWEARLTIGYREGKPISKSMYAPTREEADEHLQRMIGEHTGSTDEQAENIKLNALFERFLASKEHVAEISRYKSRIEAAPFLNRLGHRPVRKIRRTQIQNLLDSFRVEGKPSLDGRRRALRVLRATLQFAVQRGFLTTNPADGISIQASRTEEVIPWSPEEVSVFLDVASGRKKVPYRYKRTTGDTPIVKETQLIAVNADQAAPHPLYALFYLILTTGLRRGEALGLEWKHIDFKKATVQVVQQLVPGAGRGKGPTLQRTKTRNSTRTLPVSADLLQVLNEHRLRQLEQAAIMGPDWPSQPDLVFTTAIGTAWSPRNVLRSFQALIRPLGMPSNRLHDLRHTYASLAGRAGVPVEVLSRRLGHADVGTTMRIYRHLYTDEHARGNLTLDQLIERS